MVPPQTEAPVGRIFVLHRGAEPVVQELSRVYQLSGVYEWYLRQFILRCHPINISFSITTQMGVRIFCYSMLHEFVHNQNNLLHKCQSAETGRYIHTGAKHLLPKEVIDNRLTILPWTPPVFPLIDKVRSRFPITTAKALRFLLNPPHPMQMRQITPRCGDLQMYSAADTLMPELFCNAGVFVCDL